MGNPSVICSVCVGVVQGCTEGKITGQESCGTPDIKLISLLRQPSTITSCDQFRKQLCQYSQHRNFNGHRAELIGGNSRMFDPIKGRSELNLHNPSLQPTRNAFEVYGTQTKAHHSLSQVPRIFQ